MKDNKEPKRISVKVSQKESLEKKIEIATQTLERNIGFINGCDTKTSIVLASVGVLLTIILTNDGLSEIFHIAKTCIDTKTFCSVLYLVGLLISACTLVVGLWKLVSVLIAKVDPPTKTSRQPVSSLIFFGGILKAGDPSTYRSKFIAMKDTELLDDLISEIYINAEIATQKYRRYNLGLKLVVLGFVFFVLLLLVGMYLYR